MAKSTAKTQVELQSNVNSKAVGTSINADIKEGKALGSIWRQTNSLKQTIKANGFDTRLGKLMQKLKAQSSLDSGQISRQTLTTYGIHCIDRRRRSEALWFVENEKECRAFIEASGFKGSSLTALQAAMRKAAKAADEPTAKAEPSNVGQSDEVKKSGATEQRSVTVQVTRSKMVDTILHHCAANGLNVEDIINDLQSHVARQSRNNSEAVKQQRETAKMVKTI